MDVFSLRGTFIDCRRENDVHTVTRSVSAPPVCARNLSDQDVTIDDKYISSLMRRTHREAQQDLADEQYISSLMQRAETTRRTHREAQQAPINRTAAKQDCEQEKRGAATTTGTRPPIHPCGRTARGLRHGRTARSDMEGSMASSSQDFKGYASSQDFKEWADSKNRVKTSTVDSLGPRISSSTISTQASTVDSLGHRISSSSISDELASQNPQQESIIKEGDTTLMICALPPKLTIRQMMHMFVEHGFAETVDLVYMPPRTVKPHATCPHINKRSRHNMGFCFINFRTSQYARSFADKFGKFTFTGYEKQSCVKPAKCQGFGANVEMHSKKCAPGALVTFDDSQ